MSAASDYRVEMVEDRPKGGQWHCGPNPAWVTVTHLPTMISARAFDHAHHKAKQAAQACCEMMVEQSRLLKCQFPERVDAARSSDGVVKIEGVLEMSIDNVRAADAEAALSPTATEPVPVSSLSGNDQPRGCAPGDFTDDYRATVCRMGGGAACCRYLTVGAGGWACAKRSPMRHEIDSRAEKMGAKGDNCDGVYAPRASFVLLQDRFEIKAGTIIYRCDGYDYGCANDDARATGEPHTSMTLEPSGDYPFFTVPNTDFTPAQVGTRPQGQDGEAGLVRSTSDAVGGNADAPEPSRHTSKGI